MSLLKIAKLTGVSTATVSRTLNNSPLVREETARRVRAAADQIGYKLPATRSMSMSQVRRNRFGRGVVRKKLLAVSTIGQPYEKWMGSPVIGRLVSGFTEAAHEFDLDIMLDGFTEPRGLKRLTDRADLCGTILLISGVASCNTDWTRAIEDMAVRLPVIRVMGSHSLSLRIDHVLPDNPAIGHLAMSYLQGLGCRRVALVTKAPHRTFVRQRVMMFASTAIDNGVDTRTYLVSEDHHICKVFAGDVRVYGSLKAVAEAINSDGYGPDGLFCPQDNETASLYPLLHKVGVRPQTDLQVVSCGNDVSQLSLLSPRPASIDVNPAQIARVAIHRIHARMRSHTDPPVMICVQPKLIAAKIGSVI